MVLFHAGPTAEDVILLKLTCTMTLLSTNWLILVRSPSTILLSFLIASMTSFETNLIMASGAMSAAKAKDAIILVLAMVQAPKNLIN